MKLIVLSVLAMLVQQALATMGPLSVAVIGPVVVEALDLNPGLIGAFAAMTYGASMLASLSSGGTIGRFGPLRLSQLCLLSLGVGLIVAAGGHLALFGVAAIALGLGAGPSTPASAQILARVAPPRHAPLIFSIKQTGVPVGGIMAGALIPFLLGLLGWQGALLAASGLYFVLAVALQPLRASFDDERNPSRRVTVRGAAATVALVLRDPRLRELVFALFLYTGLQLTYGSFFVAFLVGGRGFDLVFAGFAFAVGQGAGFCGRILWGWAAGRFGNARFLLGLLGVLMAATGTALALIGPGWSETAVIVAVIAFGLTGMSFQGVLLAETVRRAPQGSAGAVTGVGAGFAFAGMMTFPGLVGAIVGTTGSYQAGFLISAAATLPVALHLLRRVRTRAAPPG